VHADPTRLKQVIINLLSNAIKYNQVGGSVEVRCCATAQGRCRVSVHDTGVGLPADKLAQLFQPFNRIGQEAGDIKGTGIGLAVSRKLVETMGGEMGVTSTAGQGSVFWFELNLAAAAAAATASPPELPPVPELDAPLPDSEVMRSVLYVEDSPANMVLIEQLLARRAGMQLLGAQDAMRGIAMARSFQPDVIVMDINLPGISGIEALKILQDDPLTARIPVLALSANAMPNDIAVGLAAGFYAYLTKPIKVPEFMAAIDRGLALAAKSA
jgi:CheY-like chemotaxis protein